MTNDAPKKRANTISRTRPRIRESNVMPLTTEVFSISLNPESFLLAIRAPSLAQKARFRDFEQGH